MVMRMSIMFAKLYDEVLGNVKQIASTLISPGTKRALNQKIYIKLMII